LDLPAPKYHHERPPVGIVADSFARPKKIAYWGAGGLTILMILIWPLLMLEAIKLDETRFFVWTTVSQVWTFLAAAYIVIVPLFEEVKEVYGQYLLNKSMEQQHIPRSARARGPLGSRSATPLIVQNGQHHFSPEPSDGPEKY